jgi:hypothetical protein
MKNTIKTYVHFHGRTVAFNIWNKPFKPLGSLKDEWSFVRVFQEWYPQTFIWHYVINSQSLLCTQAHGSYIINNFNNLNMQTTSSRHPNITQLTFGKLRQYMLQKVQSELTQAHGISIFKKRCIPKFMGVQCDKNNQGWNLKVQFLFCVSCAMLDSLKLLTDLCNECWTSDSQTRRF